MNKRSSRKLSVQSFFNFVLKLKLKIRLNFQKEEFKSGTSVGTIGTIHELSLVLVDSV